jgi:hypothetical protein
MFSRRRCRPAHRCRRCRQRGRQIPSKSLKARRVADAFGRVQEQIAHDLQEVSPPRVHRVRAATSWSSLIFAPLRPCRRRSSAIASVQSSRPPSLTSLLGEVIHRLWILAIESSNANLGTEYTCTYLVLVHVYVLEDVFRYSSTRWLAVS